MLMIRIPEVRDFMAKLLQSDVFDTFLVSEAAVTTFVTYHIDGTVHPDFYDSREDAAASLADDENCCTWRSLKQTVFSLIRGSRSPLKMHIVLRLSKANTKRLALQEGLNIDPAQISGLFLNIHYDRESLYLTTGCALSVFSLDKAPEHSWDDMITKFLKAHQIPFTIE